MESLLHSLLRQLSFQATLSTSYALKLKQEARYPFLHNLQRICFSNSTAVSATFLDPLNCTNEEHPSNLQYEVINLQCNVMSMANIKGRT